MIKMDYAEITQNNEVIKLLKKRKEIEDEIYMLDENALINYELKLLTIQLLMKPFLIPLKQVK